MKTITIALFLCASACVSGAAGVGSSSMNVHQIVARIQTAEEPARSDISAELASYIFALNPEQRRKISAEDVREIAGLLSDTSNTVRIYAVTSLGDLGTSAASTVPMIRAAIRRIEEKEGAALVKPSVGGAYPYYLAIHKITGEPIPKEF